MPVGRRSDTDNVRAWANLLAGEARGSGWITDFYVWPDEVRNLAHQLDSIRGGLIGLVGTQGIGKSSALMALYRELRDTRCAQEDLGGQSVLQVAKRASSE